VPLIPLDALDRAARTVGDRWSLLILGALLDGDRRYKELHEQIPGIATNVLAQRLTALEGAGLIVAEPYSRRPPRMSYSLTGPGRDLAAALAALAAWGADQADAPGSPGQLTPRHDLCGTPLAVRWFCPTCEVPVDIDPQADDDFTFHA
jgi:DNA-binding HxlR family transcriptional regulator